MFDEQRYFQAGPAGAVIDIGEERVGLTVCEDIWEPGPPATDEALAGATLIVNISASPYHAGKGAERERMFAQRARDNLAYVAFCALVGGQDELVFDGHSFVIDHTGETIARAAQFREELLVCDVDLEAAAAARLREAGHRGRSLDDLRRGRACVLPGLPPSPTAATGAPAATGGSVASRSSPVEAEVYAALTLGLRDYVEKNGFEHVVLGLSGGIDSALVACLAADALGAERVSAAIMPSPYSSSGTQQDARALAAALGVRAHELPIESVVQTYEETLGPQFEGRAARPDRGEPAGAHPRQPADGALEQVRLARAHDRQQVGDVGRLHDALRRPGRRLRGHQGRAQDARLPPVRVAQLARGGGRRARRAPIPASIIERAPSAELRPDQRDEDSLPPYELLDRILHGYVELHLSREQLIAQGLPEAEVERAIRLVDLAEYKRRQAPPGIKVTERAFGRDRRMPITNRYRG